MDTQWLQIIALGAGALNFIVTMRINVEIAKLRAEMYEKFLIR